MEVKYSLTLLLVCFLNAQGELCCLLLFIQLNGRSCARENDRNEMKCVLCEHQTPPIFGNPAEITNSFTNLS